MGFVWACVVFSVWILIGAGLWAYWDDDQQTLLKQAKKDHEYLPQLLMLTWPVFLWKWLRRDKYKVVR